MPFQKGHQKIGGKQKGTENKLTKEIKEAFKQLLENNLDNMTTWLNKIAKKNPSYAFQLMLQLAEYNIPKLQRSEVMQENRGETVIRILRNGTNGQSENPALESAVSSSEPEAL